MPAASSLYIYEYVRGKVAQKVHSRRNHDRRRHYRLVGGHCSARVWL
jgi:hypothetical protein